MVKTDGPDQFKTGLKLYGSVMIWFIIFNGSVWLRILVYAYMNRFRIIYKWISLILEPLFFKIILNIFLKF